MELQEEVESSALLLVLLAVLGVGGGGSADATAAAAVGSRMQGLSLRMSKSVMEFAASDVLRQ